MAHPFIPDAPEAGGAPGELVAPVAPAVVAVGPPRNYRELLSDEANSPTRDRLATFMQGYRFEGGVGPLPAPTVLREQTAVWTDRQPIAFLCLVAGPGGYPEVSILHRMIRYMDMPGEDPSGFHDRYLGLLGDIMPHQYPTVEVPSTVLHLVGTPVRVPTNASMAAHVAAWADPNVPLGPFTDEVPETEVVRPRNVQVIPGYYASLLIHRRGVNARVAYQEIQGAMQARGELDICQDVLTWLKASCTARGGGGLQNGVPIVYHPLAAVHLPESAYRYLTDRVASDLPALTPGGSRPTELDATLAGALRALTRATGGGGEGGETTREPKSVQDVYRETFGMLTRYCNVEQPNDVAPIWRRLANCTKSERHTIMLQEFQRVCNERRLSTEIYVPIVTTSVKQMILGFHFVGHGVDDLATGCQPFLVTYAGGAHHVEALNAASLGNQLAEGDQNANLADIRTIREKEKLRFPTDINQTCITIFRYAVLCQALFQGAGDPHPFVEALWKLAQSMQNAAPFIVDKYQQLHAPALASIYFPSILRTVQVLTHEYMQQVEVNQATGITGVDLPDFRDLLSDLRRGTFQNTMIPIPETYLNPSLRTNAMGSAQSRSSGATSATAAASSSAATAFTGVSALTDGTPRPIVARVENPSPDAEFSAITVRAGGFRPILRDRRAPTNDAGAEFCVAWWLRGACFPNCGKRATHVPFSSAAERTRLLNFCREHLAAPSSAPPWAQPRSAASRSTSAAGDSHYKRTSDQVSAAEDSLGKLAIVTSSIVSQQGWKSFVDNTRGASNLSAQVGYLPHKASRLLQHLRRRGASIVLTSAPWGTARRDAAMARGPHKSSHDERAFVFKEMQDFCTQGYWAVLPYAAVRHWTGLRVSPLGVVPQRDRRPRLIVDYSFSGINDDTLPLAPRESMQFGRALQRILAKIVHADPRYGPVYMSKIDIADGFYRVWLQHNDIVKLGVALPTSPGEAPLVAFPLALPMGWVESPPYFTALTETACDLANDALRTRSPTRPHSTAHRLETVAATPPPDAIPEEKGASSHNTRVREHRHARPPVAAVDVYVDDFLLLAQTRSQTQRVLRTTLHSIDKVLRPLAPDDPPSRQEPASVKKMLKGDACWSTHKRNLGWDIDTRSQTLSLSPHRLARLYELLNAIKPPRKRVSIKIWHQLLGELRSMALALPGARGLFSVLQDALSKADRHRVRITQRVWDVVEDFTAIANSLRLRPTRLPELVPTAPLYIGASDACGSGMGGVWFHATDPTHPPPIVWRTPFDARIGAALITADNPSGTISISDLELLAMIAHKDILAAHADIAERTLWMVTDNRAALAWSAKGLALANASPAALHAFRSDLCAVQAAARERVSQQRRTSSTSAWTIWTAFCVSLGVDTDRLPSDPIPLIQVFAQRLRAGTLSARGNAVRSRTVEDVIRGVGQAYASMGSLDPRMTPHGRLDFRLTSLYRAWARTDPSPSRVKPLPVSLLSQFITLAHREATPAALAAAEVLTLGFFFLLRPGEYLGVPDDNLDTLFRLRDLTLWAGSRALDHIAGPIADLYSATFVTLTFTRQKNGVRNETVGHGRSGHPHLCPVLCLVARIVALRAFHASPATSINAFRDHPGMPTRHVRACDITKRLRNTLAIFPDPAIPPTAISARSTRPGGAMALLCAGVGSARLRMVGRWRSDELFRYLHVQAPQVMTGLSATMLRGGQFQLAPG